MDTLPPSVSHVPWEQLLVPAPAPRLDDRVAQLFSLKMGVLAQQVEVITQLLADNWHANPEACVSVEFPNSLSSEMEVRWSTPVPRKASLGEKYWEITLDERLAKVLSDLVLSPGSSQPKLVMADAVEWLSSWLWNKGNPRSATRQEILRCPWDVLPRPMVELGQSYLRSQCLEQSLPATRAAALPQSRV